MQEYLIQKLLKKWADFLIKFFMKSYPDIFLFGNRKTQNR
jgi:hypothetical protein